LFQAGVPPVGRARVVGGPAAPAAIELGTGSGGSSGWGGGVVRASHRARVALARTSLDGRRRVSLRAHPLRGPPQPGQLAQAAPQAVMQRKATRAMLRLDVRRCGEPLRRVCQWDRAPSQPLEHEDQRGDASGPAIGGRRQRDHALPTVCVGPPLHRCARTRAAAGASAGHGGSDRRPSASR